MRIKVTTQVDADMQKLFLAAASVHGKNFAEALDTGMRLILKDIDPVAVIEQEISARSAELEDLRKLRAEMRVLEPTQMRIKQYTQDAQAIEKTRSALWEQRREYLKKELRRGDLNWNVILWDFQFASRKEALAWFRHRIALEETDTPSGGKT